MTDFLHVPPLADRCRDGAPNEQGYSPRDHARRIGITEADLLEMDEGSTSARLLPDWPGLLAALGTLGPTVARTCNAHAVLESSGIYPRLQGDAAVGRYAGSEVELRLLLPRWIDVWAVKQGGRSSLQVFGRDGAAIHKMCLTGSSNRAGWLQLLEAYASTDPPSQAGHGYDDDAGSHLDAVAVNGLRAACGGAPGRARSVPTGSVRQVLQAASEARLAIEATVGNPGCVHTCKALVGAVLVQPPWLEAVDARARLRLREAGIAEARVVLHRTDCGVVSALKMFGRSGGMIAALSSRRGADVAEERRWRAILDALPSAAAACAGVPILQPA